MEDLAATPKRHASRTRHRTAIDEGGKLLAMEIEIATDGGAYATLSSTVLSRATLHSTGPYVCPNIRITSRAYATNTVPAGACFVASVRRIHLCHRAPHGEQRAGQWSVV